MSLVIDSRSYALAVFVHGGIGRTNNGGYPDAVAKVYLNLYLVSINATNGDGFRLSKHEASIYKKRTCV